MTTDEALLALLSRQPETSSGEMAKRLGISRQAAHRRLQRLARSGKVAVTGQGRWTRYRVAEVDAPHRYRTRGLEEDRVWTELAETIPGIRQLHPDARAALHYALTEIVNNAIEHSRAQTVEVSLRTTHDAAHLEVADRGIGAFRNVREAFGLADDLEALQEISKGKSTTAPEGHTGEGLFFVSKVARRFRLESGGLAWIVDGQRQDHAVQEVKPPRNGTLVRLEIDSQNPPQLAVVFSEYTDEFEFSRTRAVVKLFEYGTSFVSRSEARRLLNNLERFREVVVDFTGVESVGQGFADEVFRVWARAHPETRLLPVAMGKAVAFMVERALRA